jgi:hypothetical protein
MENFTEKVHDFVMLKLLLCCTSKVDHILNIIICLGDLKQTLTRTAWPSWTKQMRSSVERSINPKRVLANFPPAPGSYDDAHPHLEHVENKEATN